MASALPLAGPCGQLASFFFLGAALFGDLLLLRAFLFCAYVCLCLGAALGYPGWKGATVGEKFSIDGIAWSGICLLLHGFALARLLLDEAPVKFDSEDEEQLWRFFYRRGGMERLEFKQVLKYGRWVKVKAGDFILSARESQVRVYLLVEGRAFLHSSYNGEPDGMRPLFSGKIFDKGLLNVFGVFIGFLKDERKAFRAVAETDCLLYSWDIDELNAIATKEALAVGAFWRNFVLCQLGMEFDLRVHKGAQLVCATGELEPPEVILGGRSRDFTDPLRSYEQQRSSLKGTLRWLRASLSPFLPPGTRHRALPISGIQARNRVIALKAAHGLEALSREPSLAEQAEDAAKLQSTGEPGLKGEDGDALLPGMSRRGGVEAQRVLRQLQSMRQIVAADVPALARELTTRGGSLALQALASSTRGGQWTSLELQALRVTPGMTPGAQQRQQQQQQQQQWQEQAWLVNTSGPKAGEQQQLGGLAAVTPPAQQQPPQQQQQQQPPPPPQQQHVPALRRSSTGLHAVVIVPLIQEEWPRVAAVQPPGEVALAAQPTDAP